jgi:hypothetical protein
MPGTVILQDRNRIRQNVNTETYRLPGIVAELFKFVEDFSVEHID